MKINRQFSSPHSLSRQEIKHTPPKYEAAKNIATIFSAIAIPVVLTIAGYYIQRQLADDGLKKDYVGIAASILKENPATQEAELRDWAAKVIEINSPIPLTVKAKTGLTTGYSVVVSYPEPPEGCMVPIAKRTVAEEFIKFSKENKSLVEQNAVDLKQLLHRYNSFVNLIMEQEGEVLDAIARLNCIQGLLKDLEKSDKPTADKFINPKIK